MKKVVQITLRDDVQAESDLIKHIESFGERSGEPKRLLLQGFEVVRGRQKGANESPAQKKEPSILGDFVAGG